MKRHMSVKGILIHVNNAVVLNCERFLKSSVKSCELYESCKHNHHFHLFGRQYLRRWIKKITEKRDEHLILHKWTVYFKRFSQHKSQRWNNLLSICPISEYLAGLQSISTETAFNVLKRIGKTLLHTTSQWMFRTPGILQNTLRHTVAIPVWKPTFANDFRKECLLKVS